MPRKMQKTEAPGGYKRTMAASKPKSTNAIAKQIYNTFKATSIQELAQDVINVFSDALTDEDIYVRLTAAKELSKYLFATKSIQQNTNLVITVSKLGEGDYTKNLLVEHGVDINKQVNSGADGRLYPSKELAELPPPSDLSDKNNLIKPLTFADMDKE